MILIDTSIWIDHLRKEDGKVSALLEAREALAHPFVAGELALGDLRQHDLIMATLRRMPQASLARDEEVLTLIRAQDLGGSGIGYIDAHLLASARLTFGAALWTRDKRLKRVAEKLDLHWSET